MTLTEQFLEEALRDIMGYITQQPISVKPTKLIVSPAVYRQLRYRPPLKKVAGVNRRARMIKRRSVSKLWRLLGG